MRYTARFTGIALALLGALAMCGCSHEAVGADGFPPPQPEPPAAAAAAAAANRNFGGAPMKPPANVAQTAKTQ